MAERNEEQKRLFDRGWRIGKAFANTRKSFKDITWACDRLIELKFETVENEYFYHVQSGYAGGKANEEGTDYRDHFLCR